MASNRATRKKKRVATVNKTKPRTKAKTKVKAKAKPKRKRGQVRTDLPPTTMTPPTMQDTRPVAPAPAVSTGKVPDSLASEKVETPVQPTPAPPAPAQPDRLVVGSRCTWMGMLSQTFEDSVSGNPICPHCGGNLVYSSDEATVLAGAKSFEMGTYQSVNPPPRQHPGYLDFYLWLRSSKREGRKCWPNIQLAADAYRVETGRQIDPNR